MKMRNLALPAALLLAFLAAAAMLLYTSTVKHDAATGGNTVTVVVSTQDIPAGTQLDALIDNGTLTTQQIPQNYVAPGALTSLDDLRGTTNSQAIVKGEQVIKTGSPSWAQLERRLPRHPGRVHRDDDAAPVRGGRRPGCDRGDHVRVLRHVPRVGHRTEMKTVALIQDVQVLDAVTLGDGESKSDNVLYTFAVKPAGRRQAAYGSTTPPSG